MQAHALKAATPCSMLTRASPSSRKRTKPAAPPSAVSHAIVVAVLCSLVLLLSAFDTSLKGSERMLVSCRKNLVDDVCPATFLAVVAHVFFLVVGVGVVASAEHEHGEACAKAKARQARASKHAKQNEPSTRVLLVNPATAESERTRPSKKQTLSRRPSSKPLLTDTKESGKAPGDTDSDASSSDSESSDAGESGGHYEGACWLAGSVKSAAAAGAAAPPQGAAHGVDGAQLLRLTEGSDARAASTEGCEELALGSSAPDAARRPQLAEGPALPDAFLCPLTLEPMQDPVVTCDGQTYERSAIEQWLRQSSTSPLTGQQLPHLGLAPNVVLRGLIRDVLEVCHESRGDGGGGGLKRCCVCTLIVTSV